MKYIILNLRWRLFQGKLMKYEYYGGFKSAPKEFLWTAYKSPCSVTAEVWSRTVIVNQFSFSFYDLRTQTI